MQDCFTICSSMSSCLLTVSSSFKLMHFSPTLLNVLLSISFCFGHISDCFLNIYFLFIICIQNTSFCILILYPVALQYIPWFTTAFSCRLQLSTYVLLYHLQIVIVFFQIRISFSFLLSIHSKTSDVKVFTVDNLIFFMTLKSFLVYFILMYFQMYLLQVISPIMQDVFLF